MPVARAEGRWIEGAEADGEEGIGVEAGAVEVGGGFGCAGGRLLGVD